MRGLAILLVVLLSASGGYAALRKLARWRYLGHRKPLELDQIYRDYVAGRGISCDVFEEVYERFGRSYGIDKRLIRPDDQIKWYSELDTWRLGEGAEQMGRWLGARAGFDPQTDKPVTLMEVLKLVQLRAPNS